MPADKLLLERTRRAWSSGASWVPVGADPLADCVNEKDLQMQAFSEAAEGIRTLDLLHGKQNEWSRVSQGNACTRAVSRA
jgi:hypothetical protein